MRDDQHRFLSLLGLLPARLTAEQVPEVLTEYQWWCPFWCQLWTPNPQAAHRLRKYGSGLESLFLLLESGELMVDPVSDLPAVAQYMRKFEADFADASVVWLSEQYPNAKVFTVDSRDFKVYRRFRNQAITLVEKP